MTTVEVSNDFNNIDSTQGAIDFFSDAPLGKLVFDRTYSRIKEDGSKETWADTCRRVARGNCEFVDPEYIEPGEEEEIYRLLLNRQMLPAGRHLWVTGVNGRQFNANCHVSGYETGLSHHCAFTFSELMKGGGVGANYSSRYLETCDPLYPVKVRFICDPSHADFELLLPFLGENELFDPKEGYIFRIPDSREGWVEALRLLLEASVYGGKITIVFDVSDVRPNGSPIRGFGGIASGPKPLVELLQSIGDLTYSNGGAPINVNPVVAMKIDHLIATAVIAGNVRRSARMSILHWNDPYIGWFLNCKIDHRDHWSTNISVEIDDKFFHELLDPESKASMIYNNVLKGMLRDGEPGFYNSYLASKGERIHIGSTNPCLTGGTVIATVDGPRTFESLAAEGRDVLVYAWHPETKLPVIRMMRNPRLTRSDSPILEIEFDSGLKVKCTPDHGFFTFRGKKIKAKNLTVGKSVRAWSMSEHRDGHLRVHGWDSEANKAAHQWVARMVYENFYGQVPEGMIIHHKDENKTNNHISNLECVTASEHNSEHYPSRLANGFHSSPGRPFYGNQYTKNHKVVAIREAGTADVFNGTVDDAHTYIVLDPDSVAGIASGIVSANCGEQPLESWENCCLGSVNLAYGSDTEHERAFRLMTRFLIRATFGDFQDYKQQEVVNRNRRIGVGFFGLQEWLGQRGIKYSQYFNYGVLEDNSTRWYKIIREEADKYSNQLNIPSPIKVTTIAPTGTIAKLAGTSEGIQAIYAKYYIRRVRYSENDPEVKKLQARGVPIEPCIYTSGTIVASFPCEDPILTRVPENMVEEQHQIPISSALDLQATIQRYFTDNAISMTINIPTYGDEASQNAIQNSLDRALRKYLPNLKGVTVFPQASRPQSPIERIDKATYERLSSQIQSDSIHAGESEDFLEEDCQNGACPIR